MTTITIDNQNYELETLSDEAKNQLASIQFVDGELQQTSRSATNSPCCLPQWVESRVAARTDALKQALLRWGFLVFGGVVELVATN